VTTPVAQRVEKRLMALRRAGLRPVQIWVPDTLLPGFAVECKRQSTLASQSDQLDKALLKLMDDALLDVDGWAA
jgi:hypothetical protein